ncbi:ligand-binding sensor domain-containing protein, partial [Rudaea sp.]|uniref:ligand-binding sensor domain-containing protein n=1 Tax=Rudaea sp. TaxID=2136325 RepID=UPI002ED0B84C
MFANLVFVALLGAAAPVADAPAAHAQPALLATPYFQVLGVADGLPSSYVYKIIEDRRGFIWVGTRDGLARYDGAGFRVWQHDAGDPTSIASNDVPTVYADRAGRIWCGGDDGLSMLDPAAGDRFVHYRHDANDAASLSSNDVWTVTDDADGAIWVGGYGGGVDRLDPRSGHITHLRKQPGSAQGLASDNVLSLHFDGAARLWIGLDSGIDVREANGTIRHIDLSAVTGDGRFNVTNLVDDADGSLLAGTRHGLLRIGKDGNATVVAERGLNDPYAYSVIRDAAGELWVGTRNGLNRIDANGRLYGYQENSAVPGSLSGNMVLDVMRDHEGGLWFTTTEGGVARLSPHWRNFSLYRNDPTNPASLSANRVQGLAEDAAGSVWAVSTGGGIDRVDPASGSVERADTRLPTPDKALWSVLADRHGQLWVGHGRGVRVYDLESGKFSDLPADRKRADAVVPGMVLQMVESASGAIWLGSYGNAIHRVDPVTHAIERFDAQNAGLRNTEVDQIGFDSDGAVLVASAAGLDRFDTTVQHFAPVPGAPSSRVIQFAWAADGTLWLHLPGTLEHYRERDGTLEAIERIDAKSGWPALSVGGMQVDARGFVWVSSARGLWRYDPNTRAVRRFDARDGLANAEFSRMPLLKRRDGSVFGSTFGGIVGFVPERIVDNPSPPPLVLENLSVRRGGRDIALDAAVAATMLAWDDRDLRLHAAALSYANPAGNRYQWKMSGVDADWVDTGNRGEREYSQLPAGRHTLRLRAANASGAWSELAPLHFDQPAPPWATRWAYAGYVLAALLLAWWVFRSYRARLLRRHALALAEQQRRFAEAASAAKSDFLATMGHEIRTPMTGVLGMTELLLRTPLEAKQRGYAEAIQSSGQMMLRMVNDSLDLARIEAGKLELEDAPFDLHSLVAEVADLVRPLAEKKGLAFVATVAADSPRHVRGDAVRIKQVFLNLANNAIKFTERGSVALTLVRNTNGAAVFSVRDTGPGIAESTRARLFQRFEQAQGTQQRHGGSGLGLAICRELVARMGGEITLDSEEGTGSTFRVVLPLREDVEKDKSIKTAAVAQTQAAPARSLNILLVEDDATVAAVIAGLLDAQGHRVRHAEHGLAALAEIDSIPFDLALLDLDLPGLDGLALARTLRAR